MQFTKYQGTGNDFVLIELTQAEADISAELAIKLCDRHFGIGADGVIELKRAASGDKFGVMGLAGKQSGEHGELQGKDQGGELVQPPVAFVRFLNPDSSVAEMCGNGVRCAALHLALGDSGQVNTAPARERSFVINTGAGAREVTVSDLTSRSAAVTVNMGRPSFATSKIPAKFSDNEALRQEIEVNNTKLVVSCASMGNPHTVIFLNDELNRQALGETLADSDFFKFGPLIEHHPLLPERTNVEFATVSENKIEVRVWERGAGETMACGTGACATFALANELGLIDGPASVSLAGGNLSIRYNGENIFMSGEAKLVFKGSIDV